MAISKKKAKKPTSKPAASKKSAQKPAKKVATPQPRVRQPIAARPSSNIEHGPSLLNPRRTFERLPVKQVYPSPLNPRKTFDEKALGELAASIRTHGVLQPIVVRLRDGGRKRGHEIIAGERRWRAAALAHLTEIPAIVIKADDKAALELMVVENLQRDDLAPMDEAEGYRQLHEQHGYSIDDLADRIGRSHSYVHNRLRLLQLPLELRDYVSAGHLKPTIALLLLAVPEEHVKEAAEKIMGCAMIEHPMPYDDPPMTVRQAQGYLLREFMTVLKHAPWDLADADLVPEAGACTVCPKRSNAQPDLFGEDRNRADHCTDASCWRGKMNALCNRTLADAAARGLSVVQGKKADSDAYARLDEINSRDPKRRTYEKLLGKTGLKEVDEVVLLGADGIARMGVPTKKAMEVIGRKHDWAAKAQTRSADAVRKNSRSNEVSMQKQLQTKDEIAAKVIEELRDCAAVEVQPEGIWNLICMGVLKYAGYLPVKVMLARMRGESMGQMEAHNWIHGTAGVKAIEAMTEAEARALAIELIAGGVYSQNSIRIEKDSMLGRFAAFYNVDLAGISKQVRAGSKPKKASKKKPPKKASAKQTAAPAVEEEPADPLDEFMAKPEDDGD